MKKLFNRPPGFLALLCLAILSLVCLSNAALADIAETEIRVSAGADDAEEHNNGRMNLKLKHIELGGKDRTAGIRFANVQIAKGAEISDAHIEFTARMKDKKEAVLTIYAEASDNAASFSNDKYSVSGRPLSSASVEWRPQPWETAGGHYQTPDLSGIIREIINRDGWAEGNALVFIISGTQWRRAVTFDGDPSSAPLLRVQYETVPSDEIPPQGPQTLTASSVLAHSISLEWDAATDDTGVAGYEIFRDGVSAAAVQTVTWTDYAVTPETAYAYTVKAFDAAGNYSEGASLIVTTPEEEPPGFLNFSASSPSVPLGGSVTLSWESSYDTVFIDNGVGPVAASGSVTVSPEHTTTYTITTAGTAGTESAQATVMVTSPGAEPQPADSFGEGYEDLIPADSVKTAYDPQRFAVITGLAQTSGGEPIEGVGVTVHGFPGYGTAVTDETGRFSMPVEGGSGLSVVFTKPGFLSAHRQVNVPRNDIGVTETVILLAEDPASTEIIFDGNPANVMPHRSTPVTDESGARACTLVFTGDNRAFLTDKDGNDVMELKKMTARVTEYSTPESMPAELPPRSGYTWCAEMTADGAARVRFEKPVIGWVNNFLGFEVGTAVPAGYFDRDKGVWIPSDNGVVVRLLDTDGNGVVDALDADGDGTADDLNNNGDVADEVKGLDNPDQYAAGATFWRVEMLHFSPWDWNWPFAPPPDYEYPNMPDEPIIETPFFEIPDVCSNTGSFVMDRQRTFHEDIPVPGTDFTLYYSSDRTSGHTGTSKIKIPVSGDTVPASLLQINADILIAGKRHRFTFDPLPNQFAEFSWNGRDYRGRPARSTQVYINISYRYPAYYYEPAEWEQAFAEPGTAITGIRARYDFFLYQWHTLQIDSPFVKQSTPIAEGWSISGHHWMNQSKSAPPVLHKGNGATVRKSNYRYRYRSVFYDSITEPVAGTGSPGFSGDNGPAADAAINRAKGTCFDAAGNLYIADQYNHRIRKIDVDGIITTVAGTGLSGFTGDGGPAGDARLSYPSDVFADNAGSLYIADRDNRRIRKIDVDGIITTVAGSGMCGEWTDDGYGGTYWDEWECTDGDGGPAVDAHLDVEGVAVDGFGNIWIACGGDNQVRKVSPNGIITTAAGTGVYGFGGDGGQAVDALFRIPSDIAVDENGNVFIADQYNHRIRKISPDGTITTVAGSGSSGFYGDGGQAVYAALDTPVAIALDNESILYIADQDNDRVRAVNKKGVITTIAGDGENRDISYGTAATRTSFASLSGLAIDPEGKLCIAEFSRVSKIGPPGMFADTSHGYGRVFVEDGGPGYVIPASGRHEKTIDPDTGVVLYAFGYDGRTLTSITDRFGNVTQIELDSTGQPAAVISPEGLRTELVIDGFRQLKQIIYPGGDAYSFEYAANDGLLTAKTEPRGNRFTHQFNMAGDLVEASDEEGGRWQYDREIREDNKVLASRLTAEGDLTTFLFGENEDGSFHSVTTGPAGDETTAYHAPGGWAVTTEQSCGTTVEETYAAAPNYGTRMLKTRTLTTENGLVKTLSADRRYQDTDGDHLSDLITHTYTLNGKTAAFQNNLLTNRRTSESAEGRRSVAEYHPGTLQTLKVSVPGLLDTTYDYYDDGRLKQVLTGTRESFFTYDGKGNLYTARDPEGRVTTFEAYDEVGRVLTIRRPDDSLLNFTYDKNGNMTVLNNPKEIDHGFAFNKVNRNTGYQTPESGDYTYVYDRDRRLTEVNFPSGLQILNTYEDGRLVSTLTPEGGIGYDYYCGSKVKSVTMGTETVFYEYDASLVTSVALTGVLNQTLGYAWNNDFDLESFTYAGDTESYVYDNDRLLTGAGAFTITRNADNGLPESVEDTYFALGRTFNGYGEADAETYTVSGSSLYSIAVTERDNAGRIKQKTETADGVTVTYDYDYDEMGRLLTVMKDSVLTEEYQYNENGSRVYEMNTARGITGRSLDYSNEDHLLTAGDAVYDYDLDGFLTTKTEDTDVTAYDYSSRGELLSVNLPDGTLVEFLHDPMGRRIAKKVNGVLTEKYLWSGLTTLLAVYDGSDSLKMRFEYADGRMPFAVVKDGVRYYLAYDQVGSLKVIGDASGNVVKQVEYDTFGNVLSDSAPLFEVPFGFAGGFYDPDVGLVRFGYRDYDPEIGRWTAKDPIGFSGGDVDLFGYCWNDPVNWVDPYGLFVDSTGIYTGTATITAEATGASLSVASGAIAVGAVAGIGAYLGMPTALEYYGLESALTWWGDLAYDLWHDSPTTDPCAGRKKWKKKPNRKKQGREPGEKKRQKPNWKPRNPPKEPPKHTPSRKN